ncbi:MAG: thioredoxin-dependent thiol peroxidase [Microthrixaceae bacterium]
MATIGEAAPDFSLTDQHGSAVSLADQRGHRTLVFFYPKANTSGCTTQACGLRDVAGDIGDVAILGISPDSPTKQLNWDEKHSLGFPLLSDPDHAVAEAYGAWGRKKLYGKEYDGIIRSAYLIDADGVIEQAWPKISPKDTPTKLLAALEE